MSRTARRWVLILCLALVVIGVVAAVVVLMGGVTVPDVTGKTQADATKALEDAGLKVGKVTQASDAQTAAGTVLLQDPAAGTEVDEGSAVALTLSSGPGTAEVPDVVGMNRAAAEAALSGGRLRPDERPAVRPDGAGRRGRRSVAGGRRAGRGRVPGRPARVDGAGRRSR